LAIVKYLINMTKELLLHFDPICISAFAPVSLYIYTRVCGGGTRVCMSVFVSVRMCL